MCIVYLNRAFIIHTTFSKGAVHKQGGGGGGGIATQMSTILHNLVNEGERGVKNLKIIST